MPPIDPQQLLKALGPLLTPTGGVRGAQEASRIASLMKDASKLVSRCIYLNILRVTDSKEALEKFLEVGGWNTLNTWLEIARDDNNEPLLGELLEVYHVMPVTVGLLKQNSAAKTIKQLSKAEKEKIKTSSSTLVDRWTKIIRGQNNNNADNDADDKKKKKKHKDKDREKDKEKNEKDKENDRKEKEEKDSEKHKNRDKDSKDHHHHRDKDKDRKDRHKDKEREQDKDRDKSKREKSKTSSDIKDSSSKSQTSSGSSESSSNKSKDSGSASKRSGSLDDVKTSTSSSSTTNSSSTSSKSQEQDSSKDDESRRRPKTVKQIVTKFRSTGLFDEDEDELEPIKKKPEKPPIKRTSMDSKNDESSEKKPRLHLTMPTLTPANVDATSTTPPEVTHGRIKLIPPKRPPAHEIQESNVFMDALQQSTYSVGIKKKKKLVSPSTSAAPALLRSGSATSPPPASSPPSATSPPPGTQAGETGPTSPPLLSPTTAMAQKLPSVPSFYRDTLEDVPETTVDDRREEEKDNESPPSLVNMQIGETGKEDESKEGDQDVDMFETSSGKPISESGENTNEAGGDMDVPRKPKKTVSWAKEGHLEEIFYFEMDETERENVNKPKSFSEMKKEEMMLDRRAMETVKRFHNDTMVEVLQWKRPKPVDNVISLVEPGCNSVEKKVQMEREQIVLCAIFFNKVPDTPVEPDPEISNEKVETKIIPLEDENGSCTEYEHTYNFNDPSSLPYDPEYGGLPLQSQGPAMSQAANSNMGGGNMNNMSQNSMGNMNAGINRGHMNIPPPISHILNTLQQQAQETRDPVMQNLQGMLTNVLQNTNPQDSGMLMERILNALEPFKNQIPGLGNLINSVTGNGMDGNMGGPGGPRFMGPGQMGNPRHGLLGSAPPGFNMMGGGGGGMRPGMQGPGHHMGNSGEGMGGNPNFYMGGGGGNMRMGGPPNQWRGGRSRPYGKRGGPRNVVCQYYVKKGNCRYGDGCQFIHPGPNS